MQDNWYCTIGQKMTGVRIPFWLLLLYHFLIYEYAHWLSVWLESFYKLTSNILCVARWALLHSGEIPADTNTLPSIRSMKTPLSLQCGDIIMCFQTERHWRSGSTLPGRSMPVVPLKSCPRLLLTLEHGLGRTVASGEPPGENSHTKSRTKQTDHVKVSFSNFRTLNSSYNF